jgi:hypothetical protein
VGSTSEWLWFDAILENPFVVGVWGFRATLYEGEGGALRGALLPITVFPAVKATGGAGLARWDRILVGVDPGFSSSAAQRIGAVLSETLVATPPT